MLLPGGSVNLQTSQFSQAAKIFYDLALKVKCLTCTTDCRDKVTALKEITESFLKEQHLVSAVLGVDVAAV